MQTETRSLGPGGTWRLSVALLADLFHSHVPDGHSWICDHYVERGRAEMEGLWVSSPPLGFSGT